MSVINKMLQDLDRRNAMAGAEAQAGAQNLKVVDPAQRGHEWFWRIVAALLLAAVAWVGWVAYQLQPRSLATEQAFRAAEQARSGAIVALKPAPPPPPPAQPSAPVPPVIQTAPASQPVAAPEPPETFKLARAIETPIAERRPAQTKPAARADKPAAPVDKPAAKPVEPKKAKGTVDKRERGKSVHEAAEAQFRRAAAFLNQGRVSEAEDHLGRALTLDPSHVSARQAYVALLLEQRRIGEASRLLREAMAIEPAQPAFALALARILVEQRDYGSALQALDAAGNAVRGAEFQGMRAVVLQRMGRHAEAVEAYQAALKGAPQPGTTWMGLGISLEALGHRAEAAEAYKRALGIGPLTGEVREYAEARIKALQ